MPDEDNGTETDAAYRATEALEQVAVARKNLEAAQTVGGGQMNLTEFKNAQIRLTEAMASINKGLGRLGVAGE